MKRIQPLFMGVFVLSAVAWAGLVLVPFHQFGKMEPFVDEKAGTTQPLPPTGLALRGSQVYLANGCVYCHTQQVRPAYQGSDIARGWGNRRTVARDYIYDQPALLGTMRLGPDLANAGSDVRIIQTMGLFHDERFRAIEGRTPAARATKIREAIEDEEWAKIVQNYEKWLHQHLYNPRSVRDWSIMPSYDGLYNVVQQVGPASPKALQSDSVRPGFQVVPSAEAEALVAYLMSLNRTYALPEAVQ